MAEGVADDRLAQASGLLRVPVRRKPSPLSALLASTVMAGAAFGLVWALLMGPGADLSLTQNGPAVATEVIEAPVEVMVATEGAH